MKKAITLTIFLLLLSGQAIADQIVLKNGDRLTGKIVKSDGSKLAINSERSYLSNPPLGFEKNDLILTTGLKIKLGDLK